MGIFSSKKKTYVSSVAYSLSGDEEDRVEFLKYTTLQAVMQKRPIAETLTRSYLTGQGIKLRQAYRYAQTSFSDGLPFSAQGFIDNPDLTALRAVLEQENPGATISLLTTFVGSADFTFWVEEWLSDQYGFDRISRTFSRAPVGVDANAVVTYDMEHGGMVQVILTNSNGVSKILSYRLSGISYLDTYVHSVYQTDVVYTNANGTTKTVRSEPIYFMYRVGTGKYPSLDASYSAAMRGSPFFPCVPIRVDNKSMTTGAAKNTQLYKTSEKLLKKVGMSLEQISDSVNANQQINEIDYGFVVFGVQLKTKSQSGKQYLWEFAEYLQGMSIYTKGQFDGWAATGDSLNGNPKTNVLKIYHPRMQKDRYNIEIQWQYVDVTVHQGMAFPGARIGKVEVSIGARSEFDFPGQDIVVDASVLYLRKQITENSYQQIAIAGLVLQNHIYNGHSVIVTAHDAMTKVDEEGFIIPLNQQLLRSLSIKDSTQVGYECMHIVFNCYQVVKKKWYQSGWFKIVLVIVAIIIVVVTWGSGTAAAGGIMSIGQVAALGAAAALGATGLLLTYLAATIYVLGMMVLTTLLTEASTGLFGDEWGAVIGAIASMVVMNYASSAAGASAAATGAAKTTLTASNLIQGTSAVASAYGAYAQNKLEGIQNEALKLQTDYEAEMKKIEDLTKQLSGTDMFDLEGYLDSTQQFVYEKSETFLARTLLTGSDIAEITNGMISNFADIGKELPTT